LAPERSGRLEAGEPVILTDDRDHTFLVHLTDSGSFQFDHGTLPHRSLIGSPDGSVHETDKGARLVALRPRLVDYVLKMRRGAQVVYPKDAAAILMYADIRPGSTVLEAGTGSGALTMSLIRAVGPTGRVVSVERREDHAKHARKTVERALDGVPDWVDLRVGDVEELVEEVAPDRIVLDLPEPWHVVAAAAQHLTSGGVFCAYVPTVPQVQQIYAAFEESGAFFGAETFEVLHRTWNIKGRSVRPDHNMVGHTGFITVARRIVPPPPE
jgi:tRNA (adenine57-N1/adenine58-N1)-methyltransferase